jgi:hypothetical protein
MKNLLCVPALLMLFAVPASAQDVEAMAKWTSYQIVHYKIVGEFAGDTVLMKGSGKTALDAVMARVTDRFEVEFDWDQLEFKLVGTPVIRNFPTKIVSINLVFESIHINKQYRSVCPEPKPASALELLTGVSLKADDGMRMSGFVTLEARRDQPGGTYASVFPASDNKAYEKASTCGEFWETAKAVSETNPVLLHAVPGMMLVMPLPASGQAGMQISADKKSFIVPPGAKGASTYGWTYTITPTGVK